MFGLLGVSDLPLLAVLCAVVLLIIALIARQRGESVEMATAIEDTYIPFDDQPRIWVSSHALHSLQPDLAQILPSRTVNDELRLVTRWHWLALLRPSLKRQWRKSSRKPIKPQDLLALALIVVLIGTSVSAGSVLQLAVITLLTALVCAWLRWLRWHSTYLVITDSLVAVVVSPPPGVFWVNRDKYPFPVGRIESVTFSEIVAARQLFGAEVGNVHAITKSQLEDDWILDMKMLPEPPTIYRILNEVCPGLLST